MIRLLTIPVILAGLTAAAVYWSNDAGSRQPADFAFVNRGDNKCLDPNGMSWMQDIRIAYGLWEGLYTLDPVTLKPFWGCADSASVDSTGTIWTIHIRPDARWSNGDPVKRAIFYSPGVDFLKRRGNTRICIFTSRGQAIFVGVSRTTCGQKWGDMPARRIFGRLVKRHRTIRRWS